MNALIRSCLFSTVKLYSHFEALTPFVAFGSSLENIEVLKEFCCLTEHLSALKFVDIDESK